MDKKERIVAAAIKDEDGLVHTGSRHHIIFKAMHDAGIRHYPAAQGFQTNLGRFVDRCEAAKIAVEAGQGKPRYPDMLFSEDLW